jgi:hypothetical protein
MKIISKIILLFSLYEIISSMRSCGKTATITNADDCTDDSISPSDKNDDYVHCCYVEAKKGNYKECWALTSYEYENIAKVRKQSEEDYSNQYKVNCNSSYLQICLILILSFILF